MATLFVDYEGGNDNYGGTSFALKASGADGAITSSTFSSATASFPNDGSLIGQYLSIFNGTIYAVYNITAWVSSTSLTIAQITGGTALGNTSARQYYIGGRWQTTNGATAARIVPGDTIRFMGSPAPTSLGITGTWTSAQLAGTTNISAATNATPIAITSTAHGLSTGDTVVITGVGGNTAANGTWEVTVTSANAFTLDGSTGNGAYTSGGTVRKRTNTRVKLASDLTQTIASTGRRAAWTSVGANVTTSLNTTSYKEHQYSDSIAIAAAFTTGKAAYFATGTLNLSGYQQVSFWIAQTTGTIGAAGAIDLRLCSDTVGNTAVNTISIPNLAVLNKWTCITVNTGAALGSSIQSIALYVNTDNAAQTFLINNIIACKSAASADSLTLSSLISKNRNDDTWYAIQSISGTRVMLDGYVDNSPTSTNIRGYSHSSGTETVTTYKREAIKLPISSVNNPVFGTGEAGTASSQIIYSGGWDRTNMSSQTLKSWFDGLNGNSTVFQFTFDFCTCEYFGAVRVNTGFSTNGQLSYVTYNNTEAIACGAGMATNNFSNTLYISNSYIQGCNISLQGNNTQGFLILSNVYIYGCPNNAGISTTIIVRYKTGEIRNCNIGIMAWQNSGNTYQSVILSENGTGVQQNGPGVETYLKNVTINDALEMSGTGDRNYVYSMNHDNVAGNHKIFSSGGLVSADTSLRHTASGFSWKLSVLSTYRSSVYPVPLSLAKIAVAANSLVTVKAWMYRDNSGLTMQLVCKGDQIAGVPSDVVSTVSATGAWEEETITFTPTEQGVVEIIAQAYGGSTFNGWVDDMTITQA